MNEGNRRPQVPVSPFRTLARLGALLGLLDIALTATTCSDQTGPATPVAGYLSLAPRFVAEASGKAGLVG